MCRTKIGISDSTVSTYYLYILVHVSKIISKHFKWPCRYKRCDCPLFITSSTFFCFFTISLPFHATSQSPSSPMSIVLFSQRLYFFFRCCCSIFTFYVFSLFVRRAVLSFLLPFFYSFSLFLLIFCFICLSYPFSSFSSFFSFFAFFHLFHFLLM